MLHLRVVAPPDLTGRVLDVLRHHPGVIAVTLDRDAVSKPEGDAIGADVVREAADELVAALTQLGLRRDGMIALDRDDILLSDAADRAAAAVPGVEADAIVWDEVTARIREDTELSGSYLAFMAIATAIAGIGLLLDQPILIVGAMVVGPDFGPLAGMCVAIVRRRWDLLWRSGRALLVGFPAAIAFVVVLTLVGELLGYVRPEMLDRTRPLTEFVSRPDLFSFFVALLAGSAGVLSLTSAKSGALVGVAISVTTVPAAANAALGLTLAEWLYAIGSGLQLLVNVAGIVLAGVLTLSVQQRMLRYRRGARSTRARAARRVVS